VGGLAASSPAVLGDRRCWFSGEEICSADGLQANPVPALVVNKIEREMSRTLRVMRAATEALRFRGCGSSRISSIFATGNSLQANAAVGNSRQIEPARGTGAQHHCCTHEIL
jgi:hypothetical protein